MNGRERAREIYFRDYSGFLRGVHDYKIVGGHRAQAYCVGGIGLLRPMPMIARAVEKPAWANRSQRSERSTPPKASFAAIGNSNAAHFKMIHQDLEVVRLDERMFW